MALRRGKCLSLALAFLLGAGLLALLAVEEARATSSPHLQVVSDVALGGRSIMNGIKGKTEDTGHGTAAVGDSDGDRSGGSGTLGGDRGDCGGAVHGRETGGERLQVTKSENEGKRREVDAEKTLVFGKGLKGEVAGVPANFTILPKDSEGKDLHTTNMHLMLRHNMSDKHSRFVTDCKPTYCVVYYMCIEAGKYTLNLLLGDQHISGSPYEIETYAGIVNASRTFALPQTLQATTAPGASGGAQWRWMAGVANTFTVNPRDSYGNKASNFNYQHLSFSHNVTSSAALFKMRSEILQDGRLQVIANVTTAVTFQLSIMLREKHILNSPMDVVVQPAEVCTACTLMTGSGLLDASIGKVSEVEVHVRDRWGNACPDGFLAGTCHSPNCTLVLVDHQNGTHTVAFTPYKEEAISLSLLVNGLAVPGSPFSIQVKGGEAPLPPRSWDFLGPFNAKVCQQETSEFATLGLCTFEGFKAKIPRAKRNIKYPSDIVKSGQVGWKVLAVNATGHSRVQAGNHEFFGWAVGDIVANSTGDYFVICDGVDEYYLGDLTYSGGSWHPVSLTRGVHTVSLLVAPHEGVAEFYCDFMPAIERSTWPLEVIIDPDVLSGHQSWFMIIQLVVLYKCLEAVLGPLHFPLEERRDGDGEAEEDGDVTDGEAGERE